MRFIKPLLISVICTLLFTQLKSQKKMNYNDAWQKINRLINDKGLPQSALSEVKKIYETAKKEKNSAQFTRSLIYMVQLGMPLSENGTIEGIRKIESEIVNTQAPVRNLLQSVAAQMYWTYLQNNRWKLYDRTSNVSLASADPAVWTLEELHQKISELFLSSLSEKTILQQTPLEKYEAVIIKGNTRKLRPVLFDILAHRALDYFENDERTITRPAYAFTINENAAFDPVADFIHHKFQTPDTAALHFKALLIYQQLLSFHSRDSLPEALMDADLRRLQFVYRHAVMPEKNEVYRLALVHLISQYNQMPVTAGASALLAEYYFTTGSNYDKSTGSEEMKYALKTAKQICEQTIADFPDTKGAADCAHILNNILSKVLTLHTEKVNIPGEAFRTLVEYQNFFTCHFRIIRVNNTLRDLWEKSFETESWKQLVVQPVLRAWQQDLPAADDYRNHSVEIKLDGLPAGEYALLGSVDPKFSTDQNLMAAQRFYVSNISFVNNGMAYFALHRNSGSPLSDAVVQVWDSKYDYHVRKNKLQKAERLTADQHGYFTLQQSDNNNRNVKLEITWKNEHLFLDDDKYLPVRYNGNGINDPNFNGEEKNARIFLFTDRSIYRPGQTVYFKGIAVTSNGNTRRPEIITGKKVKLYLKDVNHQTLDSLTLSLNEFGSVQGQFRLPVHSITGNFYLQTEGYNQSNQFFSVEEYKRPKFQVLINKPEKSYILNDTVTVTGSAIAYAGNALDGASVKYRVTRRARILHPWLYSRSIMPGTSAMEMISGVTKTDTNGAFSIQFNAIPDLTIRRELNPVFDYSIEADVTDINGETHSSSAWIQVGYQALQLTISIPRNPVPVDSLSTILISSNTLNGEFEPVHAQLSIFRLENPKRLIRKRYWATPDKFLFSKAAFITLFPHDEYNNESDYHNWEKENIVFSDSLTTTPQQRFAIPGLQLKQGWYVIEMNAKDRYGSDVKTSAYIQLFDQHSRALPSAAYQWHAGPVSPLTPGQTAYLYTGSAAEDVFLIQQKNKRSKIAPQQPGNPPLPQTEEEYQFYRINNEVKSFTVSVNEGDRGGFGIMQFYVKHNRFYTINQRIDVPWTNKQLNIRFTTFRDKLKPGSQENWSVQISGKEGEKIAAEMMAALYDASLDQFRPHHWQIPAIWPNYHFNSYWAASQNFTGVQSHPRNTIDRKSKGFIKNYDRLIDTEFSDRNPVVALGYAVQKRGTGDVLESAITPPQEVKDEETKINAGIGKPEERPATPPETNAGIRKSFNETAFFYPGLKTDPDGNISFSFSVPEALTQWKLMMLAHTPSLAFGYAQQFAVTQKELMVQPNMPRFVREKDNITLSTKIVNLSDSIINGFVKLELFDAGTHEPVDDLFYNAVSVKGFSASPGQSEAISFQIRIPGEFTSPLLYRISASSAPGINSPGYTDGEENILPVLSNRVLVTESLPLTMNGAGTKSYRFAKLLQTGEAASTTHKNFALTVEYTANPVWYAIQALPYLTEYPYDCSEQIFNRYYANTIARYIANSTPRIKAIYNQWHSDSIAKSSLISGLVQNQDLKGILLEETPWILQAKTEAAQKQQIAVLFDVVRMSDEASANLSKLKEMQSSNGGFVWFKGGADDRYITQYILTGIGHLQKLHVLSDAGEADLDPVTESALQFADARIREDYEQLLKTKANLKKNNLSRIAVQYLYMRSFFRKKEVNASALKAYQYYQQQAKQFWPQQSTYLKAMIALTLYRNNDKITSRNILASIKENAIKSETLGMYWKDNRVGYYWYEAPIETQALLIETFSEITQDTPSVNDMKHWLLNQKQTQYWSNTKATAAACYALLMHGTNLLSEQPEVHITLGTKDIYSPADAEAGTGYFKYQVNAGNIQPAMGNIQVTVKPGTDTATKGRPSRGTVYWQYFEDLDKVTGSGSNKMPLSLKKQLFVERQSDKGPVLEPVALNTVLEVGDKVIVSIELHADRDMEYVHLKDTRASGTEPVNVLSSYKWQGGLGYYESTKDASTHFFFSWLRKGTYVFEYPMFVTHKGRFAVGIAAVQCMYAPEFVSHSNGTGLTVQ